MLTSRIAVAGAAALLLLTVSGCAGHDQSKPYNPPAADQQPAAPALPKAADASAVAPPAAPKGKTVEVNWTVEKRTLEVTKGVNREVWTFNGQVPGPTIRVTQGDTVKVTLTNKDNMAHSIDLHAAQISPQRGFKAVQPGQSFTFEFVANHPGIFAYHCGTEPMLMHIGNGMYGAIIVDPADGRAPAKEYVLVQSEWYKDPNGLKEMEEGQPIAVAFNGKAAQYMNDPLPAKVGEKVRLYVANPGPNHFSAFHVVGTMFDLVQPSGNPDSSMYGLQTWTVGPGDAAMFELTLPEAGSYPFVSHSFSDATRGAIGLLKAE